MSVGTAIMIIFGVIFALLLVSIIWAIAIYNSLVAGRELVNEGWSSIDVQLKRRFNLIRIWSLWLNNMPHMKQKL